MIKNLENKNIELARTTEKLQQLQDFNNTVINTVPALLIVTDPRMKVIFVSDKHQSYFETPRESNECSNLNEILPPGMIRSFDLPREIEKMVSSSDIVSLPDYEHKTAQNGGRFYRTTLAALPANSDKNADQVLIMVEDVTQVKRLQIAIEENANYLSGLINNSLVAIITTDADGKILLFNEGAEKLTAYPKADVEGREFERIFDRKIYDNIIKTTRSGKKITDFEDCLKSKDGSLISVNVFAAGLRDWQNKYGGALIICTDIRKRKKIERDLLRRSYRRYQKSYRRKRNRVDPFPAKQTLQKLRQLPPEIESRLQRKAGGG